MVRPARATDAKGQRCATTAGGGAVRAVRSMGTAAPFCTNGGGLIFDSDSSRTRPAVGRFQAPSLKLVPSLIRRARVTHVCTGDNSESPCAREAHMHGCRCTRGARVARSIFAVQTASDYLPRLAHSRAQRAVCKGRVADLSASGPLSQHPIFHLFARCWRRQRGRPSRH